MKTNDIVMKIADTAKAKNVPSHSYSIRVEMNGSVTLKRPWCVSKTRQDRFLRQETEFEILNRLQYFFS